MEELKRRRVALEGGFPWGFRMSGGAETGLPLTIARVNSGSKAALQGIVENDIILTINGQTADRLTNKEAHDLVKSAATALHLELSQPEKISPTSVPKMPSSANEKRQNQQISGSETQSAQSQSNQTPSKTSAQTGSPSLNTTYRCNSFKPGTWSPGQVRKADKDHKDQISQKEESTKSEPAPPPVWTPSLRRSSSTERKEFRPVRLETSSLRRQPSNEGDKTSPQTPPAPSKDLPESPKLTHNPPVSTNSSAPYSVIKSSSTNTFPGSGPQRRPPTVNYKSSASSVSTPVATPTSHLPKVPNPTVTLLQKAREGQLPKGAAYLESQPVETNTLSRSSAADTFEKPTTEKFTNGSPVRKETNGFATLPKSATPFTAGGATQTRADEGVPLAIYPAEKDANYHHWYRRMYDSLHRTRNPQDDFITVRYKANKVRGGYLSEPEPFDYDSDYGRFSTLDRRHDGSVKDSDSEATLSRSLYDPDYGRPQPGSIADYEPGHSSIVEQERKKVQKQINIPPNSFTAFALKEGGYESDSQLVFRRKSEAETPSDPGEQRAFYRDIQRGGEVPLHGLRKPVPEKPQVQTSFSAKSVGNVQGSSKSCPNPPKRSSSRFSRTLDMLRSSSRDMFHANSTKRPYDSIRDNRKPLAKNTVNKTVTSKVKTWRRIKAAKTFKDSKPEPESQAVSAEPQNNSAESSTEAQSTFSCSSPEVTENLVAAAKQESFKIPRSFSDNSMFEPTANVYLQQRRIVSDSKFRQHDLNPGKLTRYQKLARDTKSLVSRLSGEIPSPEKLRQVLKLPPKAQAVTTVPVQEEKAVKKLEPVQMQQKEDPTVKPTEELSTVDKSSRFQQLKSLYSSLEKMSELEKKTTSMIELGLLSSQDVVDYELWKKLRDREKAEREFRSLSAWIHSVQKSGECFLLPSDPSKVKWSGDSGLRIKNTSVDQLKDRFQQGSQTLPRCHAAKSALAQRWSSLTGEQITFLRSRLSEIYEKPNPKPDTKLPKSKISSTLLLKANSSLKAPQVALSIQSKQSHVALQPPPLNTLRKTQSLKICKQDMSESEKRNLSSQLSQEVQERFGRQRSTVQYSRRNFQSPVSSRHSSMSDQSRDFLLVLTPASKPSLREVESAVKEWAATKRAPSVPQRSSSLALRTVDDKDDDDDSSSLNSASSVQTVIHRDVGDKIKFFESRITQIGQNDTSPSPSTQRRSQSFKSVTDVGQKHQPSVPKRSQSLPSRRGQHVRKQAIGQASSCVDVNGKTTQNYIFKSGYLPEKTISTIELHNRKSLTGISSNNKAQSLNCVKRSASSTSYSRSYLTLVKQGDVSSKRKLFSPVESKPILQSKSKIPQESKIAKSNKTIIKDQEKADISFIKRKYEIIKSKTTKMKDHNPSRNTHSDSLHAKLTETKKHVSFPNVSSDSEPIPDNKTQRNNFKKVKQTLLSSARLAYLQAKKTTTTNGKSSSIEPTTSHAHPKPGAPVKTNDPESLTKTTFDPALHQPKYRYTPRFEPHPTYDTYGTYPRRREGPPPPPRPPPTPPSALLSAAAGNFPRGPAHHFKESQVTIHYKSPIRKLQSPTGDRDLDEDKLREVQAEHMRQVYEQERRRKILQELEDIESRRHMDNLLPSQKSPIPLNRYDDFMDDKPRPQRRDRTPEPKTVARALYNFVALNSRELPFHKGDIIFIRRQIDRNWYEGEHNAMVGIFPTNYVEIISQDNVRPILKNPAEGQARVKYNFTAQTPMELSLIKGELVILTRRIDENWLEGQIGHRKGMFPASYVDVLRLPSEKPSVAKPLAHVMTHSLMTNGSLRVNNYRNSPYVQQTQPRNQYSSLPILGVSRSGNNPKYAGAASTNRPAQQTLRPDALAEPVPYRVLYPYVPQNQDELELQEGDTVCVLEKCDDGWYVGSCQRTGRFGTFPGNYVHRY